CIGYWVVGFLIVVPQVLPVVWHQLLASSHAIGAAAAAGQIAQTILEIINIVLLLLPWAGSFLILGLLVQMLVKVMLRARARQGFTGNGHHIDHADQHRKSDALEPGSW
ncbi:MAG: hypothetical protein M3319_07825, partial [Actinomycetota bacterium]|nr:hypothetical protein [Actinomycetota bacterium]